MTARRLPMLCAALALVAVPTLSGCGSDDADGGGTGDSSQAPDDGSGAGGQDGDAVVLDVTIEDGEVTPAGEQVEVGVGQTIELHVDSDQADELHVHSDPEHEFEVEPGDDQVFTFTVDVPSQVEVETHETGVLVAQLVVS